MPYGNKAFNMTVILPNEGKTTADVLNNLTAESWIIVFLLWKPGKWKSFIRALSRNVNLGWKIPYKIWVWNRHSLILLIFSNMTDQRVVKISFVKHDYLCGSNRGRYEGSSNSCWYWIYINARTTHVTPVFRVQQTFVFIIRKSTNLILRAKWGKIEKVLIMYERKTTINLKLMIWKLIIYCQFLKHNTAH